MYKWKDYVKRHKPVTDCGELKVPVISGMLNRKSKHQRRAMLSEVGKVQFWKKVGFVARLSLGSAFAVYVTVLTLLPQAQYDALNAWLRGPIKPLISGVAEVQAQEAVNVVREEVKPQPTASPEPVADRAYYVKALHEEAQKAGVRKALVDRLITIVDKCENSRWDAQGKNVNKDGTYDLGAFQINSWWHSQRVAEVYGFGFDRVVTDPDLSTHYVINYILKPQGNTSAWTCDGILVKNGELPVWH